MAGPTIISSGGEKIEITNSDAIRGLNKIVDEGWFPGLHDGNKDFTEAELQAILNLDAGEGSKTTIDEKDQAIHHNIKALTAKEFYALAQEFRKNFPDSSTQVSLSHLFQETGMPRIYTTPYTKNHHSASWEYFFDRDFTSYFAGLCFSMTNDPRKAAAMLDAGKEVGGNNFSNAVEDLFLGIINYVNVDAGTVEGIYAKANALNDKYFVPHGFFFQLTPNRVNRFTGKVLSFAYEKLDLDHVEYYPNPYVEGGEIRVFYVRDGISPLEEMAGAGDQTGLHLGEVHVDKESLEQPLTGASGPKVNLNLVKERRKEIEERYNKEGYEYLFLLQKAFGKKKPDEKKIEQQVALSTATHELRHVWDILETGDTKSPSAHFDSEVSAQLAELAIGPTPFAELEFSLSHLIQADGNALVNTNLEVLTLLARKLGVVAEGEFLIEETTSGFEWIKPNKETLLKKLKTLSETRLQELASEIYRERFGREVLPQKDAHKATQTEEF